MIIFLVELQVLLNWLTVLGNLTEHNWIRTNRGGGANISGAQGRKVPKYGPGHNNEDLNFAAYLAEGLPTQRCHDKARVSTLWGSLHSLLPFSADRYQWTRHLDILSYSDCHLWRQIDGPRVDLWGVTVGHAELRVAECHFVQCHVFCALPGTIGSTICSASVRNEGPQSHQSQFDVCERFFKRRLSAA